MRKLFTLIALLAICFGAKAETIVDAYVDFSTATDVKLYGWGGSESARARISIQSGCLHFESTEATDPSWDCQFFPIGDVNVEVGQTYTMTLKMKGDHAANMSAVSFGGLSNYGNLAIPTDWTEVTVTYENVTGTDGNVLFQCGDYVGSWDIQWIKITHEGKKERPATWKELLTNGNAEKAWDDPNIKFNDQEKNYTVCVWGKEKGTNVNPETQGSDPHPAEIVVDPADSKNHAFIIRGAVADTEGDASAWDNQLWLQSPRAWKNGETFKLSFRYKASEAVTAQTQVHHQNPSDYLHYVGIGDISFTTEWQTFEKEITVSADQATMWSVAFNLNSSVKTAVDFYIDDVSWGEMVLDKGLFVSATNTVTGLVDYDFDSATEFTYDENEECYVATVGTKGKKDTWVNEIMISTVRGNDRQFKANTIKNKGALTVDSENWPNIEDAANAKIKLPAAGVWTVMVDLVQNLMHVEQIEGEAPKAPIVVTANQTKIVVNAVERDWKPAKTGDGVEPNTPQDGEEGVGEGQVWDNQFVIMANRELESDEETYIEFKYKAAKEAKASTQVGGSAPGAYVFWNCIGDVNFTTEEQTFTKEYTIPKDGSKVLKTQSITFNLAELKAANTYEFYDIIWKLKDDTESLIDMTGEKNFFVKVGAGTSPVASGIAEVAAAKKAVPTITVNLAGQRVSKDYKGIVIKGGKAVLNK
ncbi:MAG: hypothetical protein Q4E68_03370 [Prevotellaceae bacterium]|nr:hypothetical protein [Prevotellaceae bacterium]